MNGLRLILGKTLRKCSQLVMRDQFDRAILYENCRNMGMSILSDPGLLRVNGCRGAQVILREQSSDIDVFRQVIIGEGYKPVVDLALANQVEVHTIIDCGANVGLASVYFADSFRHSRLFAIEADPGNFDSLCRNVSSLPQITPINKAVWYGEAELALDYGFRDGRQWAASVTADAAGLNAGTRVDGVTIDGICEQYRIGSIDLLKVDIEGAEAEIFIEAGRCRFLEFTKLLAMEIHDEFTVREKIYEVLRSYGFLIFNSGETTIAVNLRLIHHEY